MLTMRIPRLNYLLQMQLSSFPSRLRQRMVALMAGIDPGAHRRHAGAARLACAHQPWTGHGATAARLNYGDTFSYALFLRAR